MKKNRIIRYIASALSAVMIIQSIGGTQIVTGAENIDTPLVSQTIEQEEGPVVSLPEKEAEEPTIGDLETPSEIPSATPMLSPEAEPSELPTDAPDGENEDMPSESATVAPSESPSASSSESPSATPTITPELPGELIGDTENELEAEEEVSLEDEEDEISLEAESDIGDYYRINFNTGIEVKLGWTNENKNTAYRPSELTFEVYGHVIDENVRTAERILIDTYTVPYSGNGNITIPNVPVYILKGTGSNADKRTLPDAYIPEKATYAVGTYYTVADFYEVKLVGTSEKSESATLVKGYSTTGNPTDASITVDVNNLKWTGITKGTINNSLQSLTNISGEIIWMDNMNTAHKRPLVSSDYFEIYYLNTTSGLYEKVTEDMVLNGANLTPVIEEHASGWGVTFKDMPAGYTYAIKPSDSLKNGKDDEHNTYVVSGLDSEGMFAPGGEVTYTYAEHFSGHIKWNDGENASIDGYRPRPDFVLGSKNNIYLHKVLGKSDTLVSDYEIYWTDDGNDGWEFDVEKLPKYDSASGEAITYYITYGSPVKSDDAVVFGKDKNASSDKFEYAVSYKNTPDSTEVDHLQNGKNIMLTLVDTTDFGFDKVWKDAGDTKAKSDRLDAISEGIYVYLWRFSEGGSIDDTGAAVTHNGAQLRYKLTSEDADGVALPKEIFTTNGLPSGAKPDSFDKYDSLGYFYHYYVTESMEYKGYEPAYENVMEYSGITEGTLDGGHINNVRVGTTKVESSKEWKTGSLMDYEDSESNFVLQRYVKDDLSVPLDDPDGVWESVSSLSFSGFTEVDRLSEQIFDETAAYDKNGIAYNFRVVERSVTYNGDEVILSSYEDISELSDGSKWYTEYNMNGTNYSMTSERDENGVWRVVNMLIDTVSLDIVKVWAGPWIEGSTNNETDLSFRISRTKNGVTDPDFSAVITSGSMAEDGYVDCTAELTGPPSATLKDGNEISISDDFLEWRFPSVSLPGYDADGNLYNYRVSEIISPDPEWLKTHGYFTMYNYRNVGNTNTVRVVNNCYNLGGSILTHIVVRKDWSDAESYGQRETITVEFVKVKADGSYERLLDADSEPVYSITLNSLNDWYNDIWLENDDFKEEGLEKQWALIETVGNDRNIIFDTDKPFAGGPGSVEGTIAPKKVGTIPKPGYEVTISGNKANMIGNTDYTIRNVAVGKQVVQVKKTWLDGSQSSKRGAGYKVELYRKNNLDLDYVTEKIITGDELNNDTIEITFDEDGSGDPIPLYNTDYTKILEYAVREYINCGTELLPDWQEVLSTDTIYSTTTGYISDYDELMPTYDIVDGVYTKDQVITLDNKLLGINSAGINFYKIWHDEDNVASRPDIRFKLYVDRGDGNGIVEYTDTYTTSVEAVYEGNKFYQHVTFFNIPYGDADGEHGHYYTYYCAEVINNSRIAYKQEYFLSKDDVVETDAPIPGSATLHHYDVKADAAISDIHPAHDESTTLVPENGVFLNSLHDEIGLTGFKVWMNVSSEVKKDQTLLPDVRLAFYRYSVHEDDYKTDALVETGLNEAKNSFKVEGAKEPKYYVDDYSDGSFAKYDRYGARLTYRVKELCYVGGSYGTLFVSNVPEEIMDSDPAVNVVTNYYITSEEHNSRDITINKSWEGLPATVTKSPTAKFILYRTEVDVRDCERVEDPSHPGTYYISANVNLKNLASLGGHASGKDYHFDNIMNNWEVVDTHTFNYNRTDGANITQTHTFNNLPIFAVSGKTYVYAIIEDSSIGMSSFDTTNDAPDASTYDYDSGDNLQINKYTVVYNNKNLTVTATEEKEATVTNIYKSDSFLVITGNKNFTGAPQGGLKTLPELSDDPSEATTTAKENIKLTVTRKTTNQTGAGNDYSETLIEGVDYTLTWEKTSDTVWKYTITFNSPEAVYAPNGNPYTYTVAETMVNGSTVYLNYKTSTATVSKAATSAVDNVLTMGNLSNALKGTLTVSKIWDDQYNEYAFRNTHVFATVQYRKDGETTWTNYGPTTAGGTTVNEGGELVTYREINNAGSWRISLPNIPIVDEEGKYYQYRVLESKMTDTGYEWKIVDALADLSASITSDDLGTEPYLSAITKTGGNYEISQTLAAKSGSASNINIQFSVKNTLSGTTKLIATKTWEDESNKYGLRPASIKLQLQSRLVDASGDQIPGYGWTDCTTSTGEKTVVSMSGDNASPAASNTWTATYDNLPRTKYIDELASYYSLEYRVIETSEVSTSLKSYDCTYQDDHYVSTPGAEGKYSVTQLTNSLKKNTDKVLTVKKLWNDGESTHPEIKVTLYSDNFAKDDDTFKAVPIMDASGSHNPVSLTDGSLSATFDNLPTTNGSGSAINYYIKESDVSGYFVDYYYKVSGGTDVKLSPETTGDKKDSVPVDASSNGLLSIVNTPYTSVTFNKNWSDSSDRFALRPTVADFAPCITLFRSDESGNEETVRVLTEADFTVKTGNSWKAVVSELPAYSITDASFGQKYTYFFKEAMTFSNGGAYSQTTADDLTFTNTLKTTSLKAQKKWSDNENSNALRPASVKLKLQRKIDGGAYTDVNEPGKTTAWTVTLTGTTGKEDIYENSTIFAGIPAYDAAGNKYTYRLVELNETDSEISEGGNLKGIYEVHYEDGTAEESPRYAAQNTMEMHSSLTVTKSYLTDSSYKPEVTVGVYSSNYADKSTEYKVRELTLNSDNGYTVTITDLPRKNAANEDVVYTVRELSVDGQAVVTDPAGNSTVSDALSSKYNVYYSVNGGDFANSATVPQTASTVTIINRKVVSVKGTKKFVGDDERLENRPTHIEITLSRKALGVTDTTFEMKEVFDFTDTTNDLREYVFEDLDATDKSGNIYDYSINETAYSYDGVTYYSVSNDRIMYKNDASILAYTGENVESTSGDLKTFAITNTYRMIGAKMKKKWSDYGFEDVRPQDLTIKLMQKDSNGTVNEYEVRKLTEANEGDEEHEWVYTWYDLPGISADETLTYSYYVTENKATLSDTFGGSEKEFSNVTVEGSTFYRLVFNAEGKKYYTRTVNETTTAAGNVKYATLLENTYTDETVLSFNVEKTWEDEADLFNVRPTDEQFENMFIMEESLKDSGVWGAWTPVNPTHYSVKNIVKNGNVWSFVISGNLPEYNGNKQAKYRIKERLDVTGYSGSTYYTNNLTDDILNRGGAEVPGNQGTWSVTNSLRYGDVIVSKELSGSVDNEFDFKFIISKDGVNYVPYEGDAWKKPVGGSVETKETITGGAFGLENGYQIRMSHIPVGYYYKITESESNGYVLSGITKDGTPIAACEEEVSSETPVRIEFTNTCLSPLLAIDNITNKNAGGTIAEKIGGSFEEDEDYIDYNTSSEVTWVFSKPRWQHTDGFTIEYVKYGSSIGASESVSVSKIFDKKGKLKPKEDAAYDDLREIFDDFEISMDADGKIKLILGTADENDMPYKTLVKVKFSLKPEVTPSPTMPPKTEPTPIPSATPSETPGEDPSGSPDGGESPSPSGGLVPTPEPSSPPTTPENTPVPKEITTPTPQIYKEVVLPPEVPTVGTPEFLEYWTSLPFVDKVPKGGYEIKITDDEYLVFGPDGSILGRRRGARTGEDPWYLLYILMMILGAGGIGFSAIKMKKSKK